MADSDFALVVPKSNEEKDFKEFIDALNNALDRIQAGKVYLVIDKASVDHPQVFHLPRSGIPWEHCCIISEKGSLNKHYQ